MKAVVLAAGAFALAACASAPPPQAARAATQVGVTAKRVAQHAPARRQRGEALPSARRVGDVVVHRVSGSYRKTPLVLTEEVVGREGALWIVDLTLEDSANITRLRVRMDDEGSVRSVARREGQRETAASLSDYQSLIEPTMLVADQNDGLLASERGTCLVGSRELSCETKSYRVRVQAQPATLRVSNSHELGGRDVEGEIRSDDGRVLYRSQLIAAERARAATSAQR